MVIVHKKNRRTDFIRFFEELRDDCIICYSKKEVHKAVKECMDNDEEIDAYITDDYGEEMITWFHKNNIFPKIGRRYDCQETCWEVQPTAFEYNKYFGKKYVVTSNWFWRWGARMVLEDILGGIRSAVESAEYVIYGDKPNWLDTKDSDLERAYEIKEESGEIEIVSEEDFLRQVYPPENSWPNGFWVNNGTLIKYTGSEKKVVIPNGIWSINMDAFLNDKNVERIIIPNSVKIIGSCAFAGCDGLVEMDIPDSVVEMGSQCFVCCRRLRRVKLSANNKHVGYLAFQKCSSLEKVIIPKGVQRIGSYAFENCKKLTKIQLPTTVEVIQWHAFQGCINLVDVNFPDSIVAIHPSAFDDCSEILIQKYKEYIREHPQIRDYDL